MEDRIWTISNALSLLRILLVAPIVLLLHDVDAMRIWAVALMVIAASTDTLDGWLARRLGQETELGRILDPLADKVAVGVVAVVLTLQGYIPLWFVVAALGRDLLILAGGLYVKRKKGRVLPSNMLGKVAVTVMAIYLVIAVLNLEQLELVELGLLVASCAMLALSFAAYVVRFARPALTGRGLVQTESGRTNTMSEKETS